MNNWSTILGRITGGLIGVYFLAYFASRLYEAWLVKRDAYTRGSVLLFRRVLYAFFLVLVLTGGLTSHH